LCALVTPPVSVIIRPSHAILGPISRQSFLPRTQNSPRQRKSSLPQSFSTVSKIAIRSSTPISLMDVRFFYLVVLFAVSGQASVISDYIDICKSSGILSTSPLQVVFSCGVDKNIPPRFGLFSPTFIIRNGPPKRVFPIFTLACVCPCPFYDWADSFSLACKLSSPPLPYEVFHVFPLDSFSPSWCVPFSPGARSSSPNCGSFFA